MSNFFELTPDKVLDAVEEFGFRCSGRCMALNSYENRVYEVHVEEELTWIVAKFYRPNRWNLSQILEEHALIEELSLNEIPVVAPIKDKNGLTLIQSKSCGLLVAIFPKFSGRMEPESNLEDLNRLGALIGRMHQVGMRKTFLHRPTVGVEWYLDYNYKYVLNYLPRELVDNYNFIINKVRQIWNQQSNSFNKKFIRVHGDLHRGNILWRNSQGENNPLLVDFDDSLMGPPVQDFWLLFNERIDKDSAEFDSFIRGYNLFQPFDYKQLALVETLRIFRMIQYSGWLAKRWDDPIFKASFPDIEAPNYWNTHIRDLQEQLVEVS